MAYVKSLLSAKILLALYEAKNAIWARGTNRSYDSEINAGADNFKIPNLSKLTVRQAGMATDSAYRKQVKADTSMVEVTTQKSIIGLAQTVESGFNKSGLLDGYVKQAELAFSRDYNLKVITEAQTTTNILAVKAQNSFTLDDLLELKAHYDTNEYPEEGRVCVVDALAEPSLWDIEVIRQSAAFNQDALKTGVFSKLLGFTFITSALPPAVNGVATLTSWYSEHLAFCLANQVDRKEVYDNVNVKDLIDLITYFGVKLTNNDSACIKLTSIAKA